MYYNMCRLSELFLKNDVLRYPVVLHCFLLNNGTGGNGKYKGGDGVKRELMFRKQLTLGILTERRVYRPYGLGGNYMQNNITFQVY